jgi:HK97 family phage portal protein
MGLFKPERRSVVPTADQLIGMTQQMRLNSPLTPLTADTAMTHSAVYACVSLYSRLISSLPFHGYRDIDGTQQRMPVDPQILRNPNKRQPLPSWVSQVVQSLVLRGNAYGLIAGRGANGLPTSVQCLNPDLVDARYDWRDDSVQYRVGGVVVDESKIWHVAINVAPGSPFGVSVLERARLSVGLGTQAENFGSSFFSGGGIPLGVLEADAEINQEQATAIKERWRMAMTDRRGVAVLGQGMTYRPISVTPTDSEWLSAYRISIGDVARFFGVPSEFLGVASEGGSMTYRSLEGRSLDLLRYSLDPVILTVESALTDLVPRPQYVQASREALLRMTTLERYDAHAKALAGQPWRTVDEIRAIENLPPLTEQQRAELGTQSTTQPAPATEPGAPA